ncbi:hypothetical protein OG2516_04618 [Oceanicola granulosus HTCC2516]|uniref:DUF4112 domain-containing protein n=1 Tax=Oceanicola granulosus (strain ATCC BAA-861 / DSM 15982 / KCTC 12143 / HTCC2516) TaxID=314256 RepID=Q2C9X0_OCEGH|nr:hypothetical protein OG2516_04618 [Oceanicola granulosus HTCC2516]
MAEHERELQRLERLANQMDALFRIPGTGIRVGADSIIGLVPGIGDSLALAPAGWIVWKARDLGAPNGMLVKMGFNVAVDTVIGAIPLIGDIFDVGWKGNLRNVRLLREHLEAEGKATPAARADAA